MADRPRRRNHRQAPKATPDHAERTVFGEGDGSGRGPRSRRRRTARRAVLLGAPAAAVETAMYAQNEQVHVGARPRLSLYDPFAHALGHEVNNAASKVYAVEGSCFFLGPCAVVSQAMIDELCDSRKARLPACRRRPRIYGPDGSSLAEAPRPTRKAFCMPTSISA